MRRRIVGIAMAFLLGTPPPAVAASECQLAFEAWANVSQRRVRSQPPDMDNKSPDQLGACLPSEGVRNDLLGALARVRTLCDAATSWFDQSLQQSKVMIEANGGFIASLALCRAERPKVSPEPIIKSAPVASQPVRPTQACLDLIRSRPDDYALVNRRCAGESVLAVVETYRAPGKIACEFLTVTKALPLRSGTNQPPQLNHECVLGEGRCSKEHVSRMFPECDW